MRYSDDDFTKGLDERLKNSPIKIDKEDPHVLVKSVLDSMIKDGYAGPMFHKEISTGVIVDSAGQLNMTFDRLLPSQESVDILKQKG